MPSPSLPVLALVIGAAAAFSAQAQTLLAASDASRVSGPDDSQIDRHVWGTDEEQAWLTAGTPELQGPPQTENAVESERARVAARFVNPRPELGCMYYDENGNRHWWPQCHDL